MLEALLRQEIQVKGPLSQGRFMEVALQHSIHGYYRSQEAIGRDFTTSPEISQVFGELIGAWAIDYYIKLGQPKILSLVELGPGKGTLMADFLRISKTAKGFIDALDIHLVEMNPLLKIIQQNVIKDSARWVEQFAEIPSSSTPLMIIANEFFDAFPTNYYVRKNNVLYERCVEIKEDRLVFTLIELRENQGSDQTWEESPATEALMNDICERLLKQKGIFLCIDYGYEEGGGESLQALFQGQWSNPLSHLGESDLTCHVHFGRLKEIALSQGLGVVGPISQRSFLEKIGLDVRIEMLKRTNPSQRASLEAAATRLTHPQQMGALFKVMAVFSPSVLTPAGFDHEN